MSKMANEENHAGAAVTTSHTLDKKNSVFNERTRKCASPADSDYVSRDACPVQCRKRSDAGKHLGPVNSPGISQKKDFFDPTNRHMQQRRHQGGTSSVSQQGRHLVSRRGSVSREDGSTTLQVDELFGTTNRNTVDVKPPEGTLVREMSVFSERNGNPKIPTEGKAPCAPTAEHSGTTCERTASTAATFEHSGEPCRTGNTPITVRKSTANTKKNEEEADPGSVEGAAAQQRALLEQGHEEGLQQKIDDQQEAFQDEGCRTDISEETEKPLLPRYILKPLPNIPAEARLPEDDIKLLHQARHSDPFGVLGPHEVAVRESPYENQKILVVRAWVRNAERIRLQAMPGRSEAIFATDDPVDMEKRADMLFEKAFAVYHLQPTTEQEEEEKEEEEKQMKKENTQLTEMGDSFLVVEQQLQRDKKTDKEQQEEKVVKQKEEDILIEKKKEEKNENEERRRRRRLLLLRLCGNSVDRDEPSFIFQYHLVCVDKNKETLLKEEKIIYDTYNFGVLLPTFDLELFQSGSCWHVDNLLGSHQVKVGGVEGVRFAVWAPAARRVAVVGDWNGWDGRVHPMRKRLEFGVWELFIPLLQTQEKYNYHILARDGVREILKIDPYAQEFEIPPKTASIISACDDAFKKPADRFQWTDEEWMKRRKALAQKELRRQPMAIYEVHLPSWMRGDNNTYLSYRELADRLVQHVKNMNFTHVEFLPLAHHPFEGSWGYQVTGQYAPYSRLGSPDDFKYLVNTLHRSNIGVFLDFVPAHFCKDAWGLAQYDGEPCYEYADPREGEHKLWGTLVFNFRRSEVRSFLLGAAYHWLRRYHIDGLRIDAVSSMLYKNHQRQVGEWIANEYGGDANLQAISLLQELNWVIHKQFPGVFTMAEESTSWQGVTDSDKGLGFDAKWDLGWMNDTLSYLCLPLHKRPEPACHTKLTFRGLYMAHEKWVLPLSHDEVVSGKGSLLDKCGFQGSPFEDRVKTLKTLFGFQVGSPGKPLIFMGAEIGQGREWSHERSVDWHEGQEELRKKLCLWLSDLLAVYAYHPALHAGDDEPWNFKWTDCDNHNDCVIAFLRSYQEWYNDMLVVCNFSPKSYHRYPVGVPHGGAWQVILNSDDWRYAGGMVGPGNLTYLHTTQGGRLGWPYCLWLDLPPFGCLYLKCPQPSSFEKKEIDAEHLQQQKKEEKDSEKKREVQDEVIEEEKEKKEEHNTHPHPHPHSHSPPTPPPPHKDEGDSCIANSAAAVAAVCNNTPPTGGEQQNEMNAVSGKSRHVTPERNGILTAALEMQRGNRNS